MKVQIEGIAEGQLSNLIYEYSRQHNFDTYEEAEEEFMKVYDFVSDLGWVLVANDD